MIHEPRGAGSGQSTHPLSPSRSSEKIAHGGNRTRGSLPLAPWPEERQPTELLYITEALAATSPSSSRLPPTQRRRTVWPPRRRRSGSPGPRPWMGPGNPVINFYSCRTAYVALQASDQACHSVIFYRCCSTGESAPVSDGHSVSSRYPPSRSPLALVALHRRTAHWQRAWHTPRADTMFPSAGDCQPRPF